MIKKDYSFYNSISVLMSVFNSEDWLKYSIESILNQTYSKFEFIIINDGSTDNSLDIIKKYKNLDSRIKLIDQKNIGLTKSLNKGLKLAETKWIARMDADDVCCDTRLADQLYYAKELNLDLQGSQANIISPFGNVIGMISCPISNRNIKINLSKQGKIFPHSSAFYSHEKALSVGGYRDYFDKSQDYDLWLRMSEKYRIGCIDKKLVSIRIHNKRITNQDYGLKQKLMAHCGLVSYYIRRNNYSEANIYSFKNEENFIEFKNFILKNLEKLLFIDFYKSLFLFKESLNNSSNYFISFIKIFSYFYNPKLFFRLVHWILFRDRVSKSIAYKWNNFLIKNGKI